VGLEPVGKRCRERRGKEANLPKTAGWQNDKISKRVS